MAQLPDFLQPFENEARQYLKEGWVHDIEFSGPTYQIQLVDPSSQEEIWTFLQLDPKGGIKDCFCTCKEGEEQAYCPHVATSFLAIYQQHNKPLHLRFQVSLWNKLCELYSDRMGDQTDQLEIVSPGHFQRRSASGKVLFFVKASSKESQELLKALLEDRRLETEETSLKFSNLSHEEIALWREGKPSHHLRYELSFWNDLARELMRLQEIDQPYQITFDYSLQQLPNFITISFASLVIGFHLTESFLPAIIPSLNHVKSPLKVNLSASTKIERIIYEKETGVLQLHPSVTSSKKPGLPEGIDLDEWVFVPGDGFYARHQDHLLTMQALEGDQIPQLLTEHPNLVKELIKEVEVYSEPTALSYSLEFDSSWNLHICPYIFVKHDLSTPHSRFFNDWVYLEDQGFYFIEDAPFKAIDTVIQKEQIEKFIRQERVWLNHQEGFQIHVASLEAQLNYTLSSDNRLSFSRTAVTPLGKSMEFGPWIYLAGKGFYSKTTLPTMLPLHADHSIAAEQIPLFIRTNRPDLQLVPGFFSNKFPIERSELKVELTPRGEVRVSPGYYLLPEYAEKDVRYFDDFVFVKGEGFSEFPQYLKLPDRYRDAVLIEGEQLTPFLKSELASLERYPIKIDPRLTPPRGIELMASKIDQAAEGYETQLYYKSEKGSIPISTIWAAIKKKERWLFTDAGCIDLFDKRFDWIKLLSKKQIRPKEQLINLSTMELIRLNALEEIHFSKGSENAKETLKELTEFKVPEPPNLSGLSSQLRPYQGLGAHWLWFLYCHRLSGLLCDDMGLGKTHQTMALLAAIQNASPEKKMQFLIICPTSVIYHWQERLSEFLPDARVCVYHGSNRSLNQFPEEFEILLTSYGIWRMEHEKLSTISFEAAIFDEIQIAKNHLSRLHISLRHVKARMRLGLTGTPIENQLRELKALFDLTLPGYMPGESDYRDLFVKPIEREGDSKRSALLTRLIKPFVLRRKKADVLLDLPEKTEEIAHCDLSEEQLFLYQSVLLQSRQQLLEKLQDDSNSIPYMHIFAILSSLKQICNHPAVFLKTPEAYKEHSSGKWELFLELLNEARDSGQKVVVFSQYLNMLNIFEEYLSEHGIQYASIRGATSNRGEQIAKFNLDPKCEVFLGSLQASGLGIDLTAGSVVIHYDRWWNAARENQATDRVHRIGQTRGVQVFKLVTKGTFEDRIDALISRKARLMEEVVSADDHRFMKSFDRQELIQLLQNVDEIRL